MTRCKSLISESDITSVPMLALYIEIVDDLLRNNEGNASMYNEVMLVSWLPC